MTQGPVRVGLRRRARALAAATLLAFAASGVGSPAVAAEPLTPEVRLRTADVLVRQGELRRAQGLLEEALAGVEAAL